MQKRYTDKKMDPKGQQRVGENPSSSSKQAHSRKKAPKSSSHPHHHRHPCFRSCPSSWVARSPAVAGAAALGTRLLLPANHHTNIAGIITIWRRGVKTCAKASSCVSNFCVSNVSLLRRDVKNFPKANSSVVNSVIACSSFREKQERLVMTLASRG